MPPAYSIDAADRTLQVLLLLEKQSRITVSESGRKLGISRSSAFRLLNVMQQRGFVTQDPQTKTYQAGPALLRVGLATIHRSDLRSELRPLLERMAAEFNETAHLIVLPDEQAFFLDCVEGGRVVRAVSRVGSSLPAHCTSGGKVLLAALPEEQCEAILDKSLERLTKRSKTSAAGIKRELATVRTRGWAMNDEESETGLRAVAVNVPPGLAQSGPSSAISVAGPAGRLDRKRLGEIAERMREIVSAAPAV
jgi:DNA-binding IclR family transcriptional regulator